MIDKFYLTIFANLQVCLPTLHLYPHCLMSKIESSYFALKNIQQHEIQFL